MEGMTLAAGMAKAIQDPVVRDRSLTAPLALAHLKRGPEVLVGSASGPSRKRAAQRGTQNKGKGQGSAGPKGKGKGKSGKASCAPKTPGPGSKPICYAFNNAAERCSKPNCRFEHVCGVCFKEGRPMFECDHRP